MKKLILTGNKIDKPPSPGLPNIPLLEEWVVKAISTGDLSSAAHRLDQILKYQKHRSDVLILAGDVAFEQQDFEKAAAYFKQALMQDPKNLKAQAGMSAAEHKMRSGSQ